MCHLLPAKLVENTADGCCGERVWLLDLETYDLGYCHLGHEMHAEMGALYAGGALVLWVVARGEEKGKVNVHYKCPRSLSVKVIISQKAVSKAEDRMPADQILDRDGQHLFCTCMLYI